MILLGNIGSNIAQGALVNNEVDFINKYGKTTLSYDKLDQLGNIKSKNFFLFFFILAIVLCILSFVFHSKTSDSVNPSLTNKVLYYLGWVFLIIIITMLGYSSYFYFFLYLPQYNEWFKKLSVDAQTDLAKIYSLSEVVNQANNRNRNGYGNGYGYGYGNRY